MSRKEKAHHRKDEKRKEKRRHRSHSAEGGTGRPRSVSLPRVFRFQVASAALSTAQLTEKRTKLAKGGDGGD